MQRNTCYNKYVEASPGESRMAQTERYQRISQYLLVVGIYQREGFHAIESDQGVFVWMETLTVPMDVAIQVLRNREIEYAFSFRNVRQPNLNGVLVTSKY
jgi:hypothetical protein